MLIKDVLLQAGKILRRGRAALAEAEILLKFILEIERERIFTHSEEEISKETAALFLAKCASRARGKPLAYLTHHKEFFGLDFYVDERVLIPRPETEILVEEVIKRLSAISSQLSAVSPTFQSDSDPEGRRSYQLSVCDIGTGSGCIAIALAKNLENAKITALDICSDALEVARENAKIHDVSDKIEFVKSDLLEAVLDRHFDVIAANLPYISEDEKYLVDEEVLKYEPKHALFAGKKGLDFFEKLFTQLSTIAPLRRPSWSESDRSVGQPSTLICEIGFNQRSAIQKLIQRYFGEVEVEWKRDLAGIDRVFMINF